MGRRDGRLPARPRSTTTERAAFEEHLAGCAACREEVDELLPAAQRAAGLRRPGRPAAGAEGADHGRGRARGVAARRRRPRGRPAARARRRRLRLPRCASRGSCRAAMAAALLLVGVAVGVGVSQLRGATRAHGHGAGQRTRPGPRASQRRGERRGRRACRHATCPRRRTAASTRSGSSGDGHAPEPTAALFMPSRDGTATASVPGSLDGRRPGDGHRRARRRLAAAHAAICCASRTSPEPHESGLKVP